MSFLILENFRKISQLGSMSSLNFLTALFSNLMNSIPFAFPSSSSIFNSLLFQRSCQLKFYSTKNSKLNKIGIKLSRNSIFFVVFVVWGAFDVDLKVTGIQANQLLRKITNVSNISGDFEAFLKFLSKSVLRT